MKLNVNVISVSKIPGEYDPVISENELGILLAILLEVSPWAYLYVWLAVNVLIKKSPGGLYEVGLRTFDTVRVNAVSELMGIVEGNVIFIVVWLTKLQTKLLFT